MFPAAVSQLTSLQLSPALPVENSPGSRPGAKVLCERVQIRGLPRLKNLNKYANSVIVNISHVTTGGRLPNVEVCFHRNWNLIHCRNQSRGIGMCPQSQWTRITKGSLIRSMSPFDHKFLDFRILGSSVASSLSKSLVFYYSGAMVVGIFLVILMVLFQVKFNYKNIGIMLMLIQLSLICL
nr:Nuclear envelope integral membrane protein [Ipomoea batatas]